jgi:hypothetical protein
MGLLAQSLAGSRAGLGLSLPLGGESFGHFDVQE